MKNLWQLFLRTSRLRQIAFCVILSHVGLLLFFVGHHWWSKPRQSTHKIAVRTFIAPPPVPKQQSQRVLPQKPAPKKTTPSTPATEKKKTAAQKEKTAPSSNSPKKKPPPPKEAAAPSPQQIPKATALTHTPAKPELAVPEPLLFEEAPFEALMIDSFEAKEQIAAFLQNELQLPELGCVVMRIALDAQGRLSSCEIVEAKSQKNAEFLKKRLPDLDFPCFNKAIQLTITFKNVEN